MIIQLNYNNYIKKIKKFTLYLSILITYSIIILQKCFQKNNRLFKGDYNQYLRVNDDIIPASAYRLVPSEDKFGCILLLLLAYLVL